MSDNRTLIKTKNGKTTSFNDKEVHEAVQFHKNNGGRIIVEDVDLTDITEQLMLKDVNTKARYE